MTRELPLYTCHKKVRALEIRAIGHYRLDDDEKLIREIVFADPAFPPVWAGVDLFKRYTPMPGDYYVVYEDGYASVSPRKAFLDGYSLTIDGNVLMERLNDLATVPAGADVSNTPEWLRGMDWSHQIARLAREAYVTINSLKSQLENLAREKADPDQA